MCRRTHGFKFIVSSFRWKWKLKTGGAHEIMSALRRLFFFCRRPADCSVIKGLMFLDTLKTIYK